MWFSSLPRISMTGTLLPGAMSLCSAKPPTLALCRLCADTEKHSGSFILPCCSSPQGYLDVRLIYNGGDTGTRNPTYAVTGHYTSRYTISPNCRKFREIFPLGAAPLCGWALCRDPMVWIASVELAPSVWKTEILAVILHPHL